MFGIYKNFATMLACAQRGETQAQRDLGCAYWWGEDSETPKDDQQARHWYTLAAEQGHCEALYDAATMYLEGEGGPADIPRALAYLRQAATRRQWDIGAESAAGLLSYFYEKGLFGLAPDADQAAYWEQVESDLQRKYRGWHRRMSKGSHPRSSG